MTEHQKIIVFDFDGVVCDSTNECMITSWNAWKKWDSRTDFRKTLEEFSEEEKSSFRKIRPRVKGAGEYYILRRAFFEGIKIEDQETYSRLEREWKESILKFKEVFLDARDRLRRENIDEWIDLHPIYDGVLEVIKILNSQDRFYIATLKDGESVRLILGKQRLEIPEGHLLDQSQIKSKLQALDQFRKNIGCDKSGMIFIDDNVSHLLEPKAAGYTVYLTTWGSKMEEYVQIAEQKHIPLLNDCRLIIKEILR